MPTPRPRRARSIREPSTASPPDRAHVLTEQRNPRSMDLHRLSVAECIGVINREDEQVITALRRATPELARFIQAADERFNHPRRPGRLIYLGAGTSGRLGVLDASEIPPTFQAPPDRVVGLIAGGDRALRKSSEGKEDDPTGAMPALRALHLTDRDTLLAIAAGGTTPYAVGALACAKALAPACLTALLACAPTPKPPDADHLIVVETGPEIVTGSTRMKAGTATKLALNTISTTLMVRSGRVYQNLMVDLRASNAKLRDRAARIISTITAIPRPEALALLDEAGGSVKTAVVMQARACDRRRAEALLNRAAGRLDRVLET